MRALVNFPVVKVIPLCLLRAGIVLGNDKFDVTPFELANLRDIGGHSRGAINVSPDGRWVAFQLQSPMLSEGDYELTWMVTLTRGGRAFRVADGGDVLLNPTLGASTNGNRPEVRAKWSPDSKSFAYLVRRDGQTQIWLSRPDRKGQGQLTHNGADVIDFAWNPDGSKLYFKTGLDRAQVQMRLREEGARGFIYDDRFHPRISAQPVMRNCGDVYSLVSLARACEPAIWIYEFGTRKEGLATSKEENAFNKLHNGLIVPEAIEGRAFKHLRQWVGQNQYAWRENVDPDTYRGSFAPLTIYALVNGEIRRCFEKACRTYDIRDNRGLWWSENGKEIVFLRRGGPSHSMTGLYAWTPLTGGIRRILQTDDRLSECATAGDRLICLYESWTQPRKIVSVSLEDGSITTLYDPNPEFAHHRFSKIEKLQWEDAFGNPTFGHLVYPIDYKPGHAYPLVIVTYRSRGFLRGGVGDEYPIHPLAAEGFFVLSQDTPYDIELTAKEPDSSARFLYMRKSVLSSQEIIIEKLADAGLIDKARIAFTGLSDGAAQTSYALTHSNITFAAAIATSTGSFSPSFYYMDNEHYRALWRSAYGFPDDPDSSMNELSIGLNADRVDTPFLINSSDAEVRASVENVIRLEDANKPVEMYVFPSEHHIKWRPDHRLAIYRRNIQWMKFWLQGEVVDDPVDPEQYTRWRAMREKQCERLQGDEAPWYCSP